MATSTARFEQLTSRILSSLPADHGIADKVRTKLEKLWNTPKVAALEACVERTLGEDGARDLMFCPSPEQAGLYATLLAEAPPDAPPEHPQRSVQVEALTMLYLVHVPHGGTWDAFSRPFILAGGLEALATLLGSPVVSVASAWIPCPIRVAPSSTACTMFAVAFSCHSSPACGHTQRPPAAALRKKLEKSEPGRAFISGGWLLRGASDEHRP